MSRMRPVLASRLTEWPPGPVNCERPLTAPRRPGPFGGFFAKKNTSFSCLIGDIAAAAAADTGWQSLRTERLGSAAAPDRCPKKKRHRLQRSRFSSGCSRRVRPRCICGEATRRTVAQAPALLSLGGPGIGALAARAAMIRRSSSSTRRTTRPSPHTTPASLSAPTCSVRCATRGRCTSRIRSAARLRFTRPSTARSPVRSPRRGSSQVKGGWRSRFPVARGAAARGGRSAGRTLGEPHERLLGRSVGGKTGCSAASTVPWCRPRPTSANASSRSRVRLSEAVGSGYSRPFRTELATDRRFGQTPSKRR